MAAQKTSKAGLDLIKQFEGLRLHAYVCPAGVLTIGYGHTKTAKQGQIITPEQADTLLASDLSGFESSVAHMLKSTTVKQNQFDALVSFAFNLGAESLRSSTLLKCVKLGDHAGARREFARWVFATVGGKKTRLEGLVRRRAAEAALYGGGV